MSDPQNTPEDEARLIEEVAGAWRPHDPVELAYHPAWHDLDANARERAFDVASRLRKMEAALDTDGLSTTARAVLARIKSSAR
jgi:hypothetical protein